MESPPAYPDSPLDPDETAYPCKGCGDILEEGKAFELAGNRWHIDCFRCNTCSTLLDSDANLLLLGDGSLICNNCTYSCSNCGDKIEDLAILTGDQAFCAACFKCRNCKKKIENLRYARTSQGIFCMDCHEALMARRRKKTARNAAQRLKSSTNHAHLDKSLPSLPPTAPATSAALNMALSPDIETPPSEGHSDTPTEAPPRMRPQADRHAGSRGDSKERKQPSTSTSAGNSRDALNIPHGPNRSRQSSMSRKSDGEGGGEGDVFVPLSFDPTPSSNASPQIPRYRSPRSESRDYFGASKTSENVAHRPSDSASASPATAPHIAYQDKGRALSEELVDSTLNRRAAGGRPSSSATASPLLGSAPPRKEHVTSPREAQKKRSVGSEEKFKLQEVPRVKKSGGSARSSKSGPMSPPSGLGLGFGGNHGSEKHSEMGGVGSSAAQEPESFLTHSSGAARPFGDQRPREGAAADPTRPAPPSTLGQLQYPPKRGDSLNSAEVGQSIPRKEVSAGLAKTQDSPKTGQGNSVVPATPPASLDKANGIKLVSRLAESPRSRGLSDSSVYRLGEVAAPSVNGSVDTTNRPSSIADSAPPRNEARARPTSPGLPRWSAGGDFSMDEDMARILGVEDAQGHESFLRRVSNSVRHGRSFSDKGLRSSKEQKWPRSPSAATATGTHDVSSSTTSTSPEHRDELNWIKKELRRERQKMAEREQRIAELESNLHSHANMKQVNSELREKRSTMVDLDTQKEMVVRELEILTQQIAAAKNSGDRVDLSKMRHAVMRDFGESLQQLKDSFAPRIEELVHKRNELIDELSNLTQMKDKSFVEFEQLSIKNAQLAEFNNQLVHQMQELYKTSSGASAEPSRGTPNGLGIYSHQQEKSQLSIDSREVRAQMNDLAMPGSGTTVQPEEAEPVTVLQGPQVVNIRKGQPKKFNWKKGGQNVAKGVTKGLKGAFSSTQASYNREMQFTETMPYGSTPPGHEHIISGLRHGNSDAQPPNFRLFGNTQKHAAKGQPPWKAQSNGSSPALPADPSTTLFGSDLESRAEYEKTAVPYIVSRCIEEVELRGMDTEGIYRKAGAASQIQVIKEGFEASPTQSADISDPDLDIHAVSSTVKQYLRRLPQPLVTHEVYDLLLETPALPTAEAKIEAQARAIMGLPRVHREVLEFLLFHLHRVVEHEPENLMTSLNMAVVFAPTIMRPESLAREMTDTQVKNEALQFLLEHCHAIFGGI